MRRLAPLFLAAAFVLVAPACGDAGAPREDSRTDVVATTSQIGALTWEVARDLVSVRTLIAPGTALHDYEPSPQDARQVGAARLVLRNGIGVDDFLDDVIKGAGAAEVVTVTEGIVLRPLGGQSGHSHAERHEEGDGHDHGDFDPHVWQDPANVKVMTANIRDALARVFPEHASAFEANAMSYAMRLDAVDAEIRALIQGIPPEHRKVVSNHDSMGYFLDRYDLEFVGAIIPGAEGAETSAQAIADLHDAIHDAGVRAIFAESTVDPRVAERLAEDTGVVIVDDLYGDSLGPPGSGADTVDGMLLANARRIAEALR